MRTLSFFILLSFVALTANTYSQSNNENKKPDQTAQDPASRADPAAGPNRQDSKITVYLYRYKQFVGSALEPPVFCDDKEVAKMDNGAYFRLRLDPGKHVFQSNDKQSGIELDLKSGEEYYIRIEIAAGFWKGHGRLVMVPKEQGAFEIKKLKPLKKEKVKDASVVVIDELPKS